MISGVWRRGKKNERRKAQRRRSTDAGMSGPFLNHALTVRRDFRRPANRTAGRVIRKQIINAVAERFCFLFSFSYCAPKIQRLFSHLCASPVHIGERPLNSKLTSVSKSEHTLPTDFSGTCPFYTPTRSTITQHI